MGNLHWVLAKVEPRFGRIEVYDSLYSDDAVVSRLQFMEPLRQLIHSVIKYPLHGFEVVVLPPDMVPQQGDGYVCFTHKIKLNHLFVVILNVMVLLLQHKLRGIYD